LLHAMAMGERGEIGEGGFVVMAGPERGRRLQ